ncbi:hypothetical protein GIB67_022633 [Kingdonia uniflora]|uniref:Laccase n=1 Tax=Kingdonia uniflora TaxID=39325 RepID=A0A7J7P844_9MAGN|nr:hypothetical protein GIB67_022633 [Kingdonia uniflora]
MNRICKFLELEMFSSTKGLVFIALVLFLLNNIAWGKIYNRRFVLREVPYTRLCNTKNILTINGQFPGPTLYVHRGDTLDVDFYNDADHNVTLHWHGVEQPGNPWTDGPEYITQCPVQPGTSFKYTIVLSIEVGTLWWHAHSDWTRATVYGAIIVYPELGSTYPFPKPLDNVPILLGSWWKRDVMEVLQDTLKYGGAPNISDAHTINGQPGDLYPCSKKVLNIYFPVLKINSRHVRVGLLVEQGKTYLLRIVSAEMNVELFFSIAGHQLTLAGRDGAYVKPFTTDILMIAPGQTMDVLLKADQPHGNYYMAARAYASAVGVEFDNTTTTAIIQYHKPNHVPPLSSSSPLFPSLPDYNDTQLAINFTRRIKSLVSTDHPMHVPLTVDKRMLITISVNTLPCVNNSCEGPRGTRLSASLNNISFVKPSIDILSAYYSSINGVFDSNFPSKPPVKFNYTADTFPTDFLTAKLGTKVKVLDFNSSVEITFQGTNLLAGEHHPIHLHGYSFYVVGLGFGNFDKKKDPLTYNFVDPPKLNTVGVPKNGWATIRFKADNPGVWLMHCHLERHSSWGMDTVFIVKNGGSPLVKVRPRPSYMPRC